MATESFRISIKVLPSSSRDEIVGWLAGSLKIKVRAPAEKGRANRAVEKLLAKRLCISNRSVVISGGLTSTSKIVDISSISEADARCKLSAP